MTTVLNTKTPNPGTKEAQKLGCKCPVIDNSYGKGYMMQEGVFVFSMDCKVHTAEMSISEEGLQLSTGSGD